MYDFFPLCLFCFAFANCLPTIYKFNENKVLEAELVPVSSTVIPLPVYQVGYSLNAQPSLKDEKIKKPEGPITLITVHSKKKATEEPKFKPNDVSKVKEVSKREFGS